MTTTRLVLADRVWTRPARRESALARDAVLVLGGALLTALLAQWSLRLSFTPVPITGQTLAVLLSGGALGLRRGAASQIVYWLLGMTGLPFYAEHKGGWTAATGATMGYFVGFILAAAIVGYLSEKRSDRNLASSLSAMALASVVIYVCGAAWLAHSLDIPVATGDTNAIALGVTPYLIGDLIKLVLAGSLVPGAWSLVDRLRPQR